MVGQADVEVEIVIQVDEVYKKQCFKVEILEHISLGVSLNESGEEDAGEQSEESVASGDEGYEGDTSDNDSDGYGTDTTITNEPQSSDGWSELRHNQESPESNQSASEEHSEITTIATVHR